MGDQKYNRPRVRHAQQRATKELHARDSLYETVEPAPPFSSRLPAPEVYVLELSPEVFDALYGAQTGPMWCETIPGLPIDLEEPLNLEASNHGR